ncbi:fl(2)d-associated complex component [Condylostylus longicornis]|uniref:fl(2)d-associated complex component n=1 Tax=Condylostylus longicornis TaxID=2530218 RepID=UPI00244E2E15|nr:fl(2)d-associated complex component [Condylostylus longicornis]
MDKKTKELLRKRKKVRPASSSESSSSSDSDSGSSSDSYSSSSSADKKGRHHRSKKGRPRRSSSSSDDEKARKREKHACHRKAEAKRSHLKRKQKEAKAKKGALSLLVKLEKNHHDQLLKERHQMREREKLRLGHASSKELLKARLSPSKAKLERHHHHQLSPREKIIIRRERSPPMQQILSPQRGPKDIRHRLEDRRSERERIEAARQKEREEALARCQERQRERERIAKEKLRRERQEKEYDPREQRLLPRPSEREMAIAAARGQDSRERSVETHPDMRRSGHSHSSHRLPHAYERSESDYDRDYEMRHPEHDRHAGDIDREYMMMRRRGSPSPGGHYKESRVRGSERELYPEDERYERGAYQSRSSRGDAYVDDIAHRRERESDDWEHERGEGVSSHDLREHHPRSEKHLYEKHRSAQSPQWEESNWKYQQQQHLRLGSHKKIPPQMQEENWDEEVDYRPPSKKPSQADWVEGPVHHHTSTQPGRMKMEHGPPMKMVEPKIPHEGQPHGHPGVHIVQHPSTHSAAHPVPHAGPPMPHPPHGKRWPQQEWRPRAPPPHGADLRPMHPGGPPGPRVPGYRAPMHRHPVGPINYGGQERPHYPPRHAPPHMQGQHHLGTPYHPRQHFPPKRQMVYTNPNLIANQKAAAAAAASSPNLNKPNSALVPIKLATASPTFVNPANKIALIKKIEEQKEQEKLAALNDALTDTGDAGADEMEPGEIKSTNENESVEPSEENSGDGVGGEGEGRDDLSEISDEADDILKEEKNKQAAALAGDKQIDGAKDDTNIEADTPGDQTENDDLLDFEEISDGELEEETRKNLGDALGVDWASLIKESKIVKGNQKDKNTTAKQKWQPHRVILDVGISMKYAGKEFAEELLKDAQLKLDAENATKKVENVDKDEANIKLEEETTTIKIEKLDPDENEEKVKIQVDAVVKNEYQSDSENEKVTSENFSPAGNDDTNKIPIENLSELACVQVAQRKNKEIQNNLVFNACGINSRALSARKDLRLRRQLCGLPVKELECGRVVSEQMKSLALKAFQKAVGEVK